jgi:hypothetical protein
MAEHDSGSVYPAVVTAKGPASGIVQAVCGRPRAADGTDPCNMWRLSSPINPETGAAHGSHASRARPPRSRSGSRPWLTRHHPAADEWFWTDNRLGNGLHTVLLDLVEAGVLERREEPPLYTGSSLQTTTEVTI